MNPHVTPLLPRNPDTRFSRSYPIGLLLPSIRRDHRLTYYPGLFDRAVSSDAARLFEPCRCGRGAHGALSNLTNVSMHEMLHGIGPHIEKW